MTHAPRVARAVPVLVLLVLSGTVSVMLSAGLSLGCDGSAPNFVSSTRRCIACSANSVFDPELEACVCSVGFVQEPSSAGTGTVTCRDCRVDRGTPGVNGRGAMETCLPCSANSSLLIANGRVIMVNETASTVNVTVTYGVNASLEWAHASYDDTTDACACPSGFSLTSVVGDIYLGAWACARCPSCEESCPTPKVYASGACRCPSGTVEYSSAAGVQCLSQALVATLDTIDPNQAFVRAVNNRNTGEAASQYPSAAISSQYFSSALACAARNSTACNLLANLCVLAQYDLDNAACAAYRRLQSRETCRDRTNGCEQPNEVPWLYYTRSSTEILQVDNIKLQVSLQPGRGGNYVSRIKLVLASYAMNGTFLGHEVVTNQLSVCALSGSQGRLFWQFGAKREYVCKINLRWFFQAPETVIHELFLEDIDGTLVPVPVMMMYDTAEFVPANFDSDALFRPSSPVTPAANGFKRRFYIYDNVGARASATSIPQFVTYARTVQVVFSLQPGHKARIYTPLMLINYASVTWASLRQWTNLESGELAHLRTNVTHGNHTAVGIDRVLYVQSTSDAELGARITVIVLCIITVFSAFYRANGWMRRQQNMVVGLDAIVRFFYYYFNHLSNWFLLFDLCFCAVFFIFYKYQADADYLLPENYVYVTATLYTAACMKGCVVLYQIFEQTNSDIFVIDWERSKGVLKGTNKELEVSMWRSTFIANEFNEMQTRRGFHVLTLMFVVGAFLEGAGYIEATRSVPSNKNQTADFTISHPLLRITVNAFFWLVVGLVFNILEYQLYYRFWVTHPLQAFVDLCSVSNISIMVLLEPQWGYYIHGESIHAHADASMAEFQQALDSEKEGNKPERGIIKGESSQTFEVYLGSKMRAFLDISYNELYAAMNVNYQGPQFGQPIGRTTGFFEFIRNRFPVILNPATVQLKQRINDMFKTSVHEARRTVLQKFGTHQWFEQPPEILFMNGPFAGEKNGSDVFFVDDVKAYSNALMYGIDFDIFLFYLLLFLTFDSVLLNVFAALALTYVVEIGLAYYRGAEGEANIARKAIFDDRFFL